MSWRRATAFGLPVVPEVNWMIASPAPIARGAGGSSTTTVYTPTSNRRPPATSFDWSDCVTTAETAVVAMSSANSAAGRVD